VDDASPGKAGTVFGADNMAHAILSDYDSPLEDNVDLIVHRMLAGRNVEIFPYACDNYTHPKWILEDGYADAVLERPRVSDERVGHGLVSRGRLLRGKEA
jgi:hypothetical protein